MDYKFGNIEKKWQNFWDKNQTFRADNQSDKPKYYALDMFPYPSGAGLHVGHPLGYTATDIVSRFKRMRGFNVLHPMGWDSFGLPAENHAIKTGEHPEKITEKNIATFKRQLKNLGLSYDWEREIATSRPDYYRWTQWIFLQLYKKGLAYEAETPVNWCPELKTVLANEEVIDGKSEIGGHPVVRRPMKQWMLKITEYAERLLSDLEELDWSESIKEMQRQWIGKSVGAQLGFQTEKHDEVIEVFTTRPDTLFGATYVVLAPEHSLVEKLTEKNCRKEVQSYQEQAARKSDLERTELSKEKSGVFLGSYAVNPVNQEKVPIWISDYILASYGTGAIMAVPAHDQRDFEFATKFKLPVLEVIKGGNTDEEAWEGDGELVNSDFLNGLKKDKAIAAMIAFLEENKIGKRKTNYKLRDWLFSRQRYWGEPFPILKFDDGSVRCLEPEELPVLLPQVDRYEPSGSGESPLATIESWLHIEDPKTGKKARRETNTMPQWAGSCWYYLRFLDPTNTTAPFDSKKENYWMPVDLYIGGAEHAVLHLLYARFWHKVLFDLGIVSTKEPFKKLVNQGMLLGEDGEKMSKSRGNVINPDDVIKQYGADSLRIYEMFMGPLEKTKPWSTQGLKGVFNFLSKAYRIFFNSALWETQDPESPETLKLLNQTVKKITEDIDKLKFNTAVSQLMIFTNHCQKQKSLRKDTVETLSLLIAPFAPHFAEELWETLGHSSSIAYADWPEFDEDLVQEDFIVLGVQINGKTRGTVEVSSEAVKEDVLKKVKETDFFIRYSKDKTLVKEIYVPGRICNLILK